MAGMLADKTTLEDLSIFHGDDMGPVLRCLDHAVTAIGKEQLKKNLTTPLPGRQAIEQTQKTIATVINRIDKWPATITNGTIMVIEKFYEAPLDPIPEKASAWNSVFYKLLHAPDYSLALYSAKHCLDLIRGLREITDLLEKEGNPAPLQECLGRIKAILDRTGLGDHLKNYETISKHRQLALAYEVRYKYKQEMHELIGLFGKLDAWYGLAVAMKQLDLCFPEFTDSEDPWLEAEGLCHLLLKNPVRYSIQLGGEKKFLFLTGANMSGKSTFIKSIGIALFLAHTGMGVPASSMQLSFFRGLISNINVTDDITKGESYFYNEVLRIKSTVARVGEGGKWMVLVDELFKGTNMQDAMKCSLAIIEGMARAKNSIFILSTHLYEIAENLKDHPNIIFYRFETEISPRGLVFHYRLQPGISRDRIGYMILEQEGVIDLLKNLQ